MKRTKILYSADPIFRGDKTKYNPEELPLVNFERNFGVDFAPEYLYEIGH